jgi:hypothetical protein
MTTVFDAKYVFSKELASEWVVYLFNVTFWKLRFKVRGNNSKLLCPVLVSHPLLLFSFSDYPILFAGEK